MTDPFPVERNIVCVDCGGTCHLLTYLDDETPPAPGDVLAYRCEDCLDRWDVVVPDEAGGDTDLDPLSR